MPRYASPSSIILGTYMLPPHTTERLVYSACCAGYRSFDTAVLYENEAQVANGIARFISETGTPRSEFFYITKLWNSQCTSRVQAERGISGCLDSAKQLGYIDLLLIHSPLMGPQHRLSTWAAMEDAVLDGRVKNIGVSNYGQHHIEQLLSWPKLRVKPMCNEIEISPWCMREELAQYCRSQGLQVLAYAPLTHGARMRDPQLAELAAKYNATPAQVLITWSIQKGYIPLPKTANVMRLEENLKATQIKISKEDILALSHPHAYEPTDWECTNCP